MDIYEYKINKNIGDTAEEVGVWPLLKSVVLKLSMDQSRKFRGIGPILKAASRKKYEERI